MDNIQEPYICKAEGFNTRGFPEYNDGMVRVNHGRYSFVRFQRLFVEGWDLPVS